ncbi:EAL domain-containing protein [Jiella sp. 40Bstr34]|uniref:EAL domain-containing protein n=2 Tax=Jiella pacifica TaxID=2696469 RepID=A0A6N9TCK9_9HYPH|nr:EAL domain-containing protein [Jiella pacifica]
MGMEVAYISEVAEGRVILRHVDAPGFEHLVQVGNSYPLDSSYCQHVLDGRLPELIRDTADHPIAQSLPITHVLPIRANMSVPLRHYDGEPFGMFCCLSPHPNKSLNERDLQVMRVFADMAANQISRSINVQREIDQKRFSIEKIIHGDDYKFLYQPIWNFRSSRPVGFEALCRFTAEPYRTPDLWFHDAAEVGCGARLEMAAIGKALNALHALPEDTFLSINASPETIMSDAFQKLFIDQPNHRLVVEVTEHALVDDYTKLRRAIDELRAKGIRLAIDDAGAGYSSLQHILHLNPDIIKLDMALTRSVDIDPARRALASALIFFGHETGCVIVAEGIETQAELDTLRVLGVPRGQGYFLGRPMALPDVLRLTDSSSQMLK